MSEKDSNIIKYNEIAWCILVCYFLILINITSSWEFWRHNLAKKHCPAAWMTTCYSSSFISCLDYFYFYLVYDTLLLPRATLATGHSCCPKGLLPPHPWTKATSTAVGMTTPKLVTIDIFLKTADTIYLHFTGAGGRWFFGTAGLDPQ